MYPQPSSPPPQGPGFPPSAAPPNRTSGAKVVLIASAAITGLSIFLPWVSTFLGSLSLISAVGQSNAAVGWLYILLIEVTAVSGLVTAFGSRRGASRVLAAAGGILSGIFGIVIIVKASSVLSLTDGLAGVGIGPYAQTIGAVAVAITALLLSRTAPQQDPGYAQPGYPVPPPAQQPQWGAAPQWESAPPQSEPGQPPQ